MTKHQHKTHDPADWMSIFRQSIRNITDWNQFCCEYGYNDHMINDHITNQVSQSYPLFIPKPFALHMLQQSCSELFLQFLPHRQEASTNSPGSVDPIGDQRFHVAPQIIHRYNNRVLFLPTAICPINCRYCFRKNEIHPQQIEDGKIFHSPDYQKSLLYLKNNRQIHEIIFSGGDPLILHDNKIEQFLYDFSKIDNIKFVRFHSRVPVILPQRLNENLSGVFKRWKHRFDFTICIHTNHAQEWSEQTIGVFTKFQSMTPIRYLSQSVLLKDVNNSTQVLKNLFEFFSKVGITPYYLHHPDLVKAAEYFYLPISQGQKLLASLKNEVPSWMIPHYVIDLPGGDGKTVIGQQKPQAQQRSFLLRDGKYVTHTEKALSMHTESLQ